MQWPRIWQMCPYSMNTTITEKVNLGYLTRRTGAAALPTLETIQPVKGHGRSTKGLPGPRTGTSMLKEHRDIKATTPEPVSRDVGFDAWDICVPDENGSQVGNILNSWQFW
jgi:hypothetical protein